MSEGFACSECPKVCKSKAGLSKHTNSMHLRFSPSQVAQAAEYIRKMESAPKVLPWLVIVADSYTVATNVCRIDLGRNERAKDVFIICHSWDVERRLHGVKFPADTEVHFVGSEPEHRVYRKVREYLERFGVTVPAS